MKKINNFVMYIIYDFVNVYICKSNYYDLSEFICNNKKEKRGHKYE